jgi:hypothetical protein
MHVCSNTHLHASQFTTLKDEWIVLAEINRNESGISKATTIDNGAQNVLGLKGSILTETMSITLQEQEWNTKILGFVGKEFIVLFVQFLARVRMSENDNSVDLASMSKANELVPGPVNIVVLDLSPFTLVLDLATPKGMDTNKEHTVHGEGEVLLPDWLVTNVEWSVPIGIEPMEGIFPILETLRTIGTIVVAAKNQSKKTVSDMFR